MPGTMADDRTLFGTLPSGLLAPHSVTTEMLAPGAVTIDKITWASGMPVTVVSYQAYAGVGSTTSATFVDYPGPHDITIVKKYSAAQSRLMVFGSAGSFVTTPVRVDLSLTINSVDHTIGSLFFNAINIHGLISCQDDTFSGIGAGTIVGRVRWHSDGVNQTNTDANDAVRLTLMEVII